MEDGFRLYLDSDGELRLDQITDGKIYALEPSDEDLDRGLGYYDKNWKLVEAADD